MMPTDLIADGWASFRQSCLEQDIPVAALLTIEAAFYGGAYVVLAHVQGGVQADLQAEDGAALMNGMATEVNDFFERQLRLGMAMRQQPAGRA
jgi:hypothetical protein